MSRNWIKIVLAAGFFGSWSGFSSLKFHYMSVSLIEYHADITRLAVKQKKDYYYYFFTIEIILLFVYVWNIFE